LWLVSWPSQFVSSLQRSRSDGFLMEFWHVGMPPKQARVPALHGCATPVGGAGGTSQASGAPVASTMSGGSAAQYLPVRPETWMQLRYGAPMEPAQSASLVQ